MRIGTVGAAILLALLKGCTQQEPFAHPSLISQVPSLKIALAYDNSVSHPVMFDDRETQYCKRGNA